MKRLWSALLCGAILLGGMPAAQGRVTLEIKAYHGWKGAYWLSNQTVELVFVPQIGRIMRYGYAGGPNILWENGELRGKTPDPAPLGKDWVNYGGDKLWPAPQERWGWPPDPILDRERHAVTLLANRHLLVTGQISPTSGIRFRREIALDAAGTGVTIRNTLLNTGKREIQWSVWEITQVDNPEITRLPISKSGKFKQGYAVLGGELKEPGMAQIAGDEVHFRRSTKNAGKIGVDSPSGWIKSVVAGHLFTVSASYEPGQEYPDQGCAEEVYCSSDPLKYVEMELLSPLRKIPPGKEAAFTTRWTLAKH